MKFLSFISNIFEPAVRLVDDAWTLLQIGMGGYVAGRSAEKITTSVMGGRSRRAREAQEAQG